MPKVGNSVCFLNAGPHPPADFVAMIEGGFLLYVWKIAAGDTTHTWTMEMDGHARLLGFAEPFSSTTGVIGQAITVFEEPDPGVTLTVTRPSGETITYDREQLDADNGVDLIWYANDTMTIHTGGDANHLIYTMRFTVEMGSYYPLSHLDAPANLYSLFNSGNISSNSRNFRGWLGYFDEVVLPIKELSYKINEYGKYLNETGFVLEGEFIWSSFDLFNFLSLGSPDPDSSWSVLYPKLRLLASAMNGDLHFIRRWIEGS